MSAQRKDFNYKVYLITNGLAKYCAKKLKETDSEDKEMKGWIGIWSIVLQEYHDNKLRQRVVNFIKRNPAYLGSTLGVVGNAILESICDEMIEEVMGYPKRLPNGIQEGDMWLVPASEVQQMIMQEHEDGVAVMMAKKDEDGILQPAFFWTENEEIIAEAQKGHRRYMELLAREGSK